MPKLRLTIVAEFEVDPSWYENINALDAEREQVQLWGEASYLANIPEKGTVTHTLEEIK